MQKAGFLAAQLTFVQKTRNIDTDQSNVRMSAGALRERLRTHKHGDSSVLAHLSRMLMGEPIVYLCSVVRRLSSSTILKHLIHRKHLVYQNQILCGASLGRGNESLFAASGSHNQGGRHAHIR